MLTYKQSDVKLSWDHTQHDPEKPRPKICGYVKEGEELESDEHDDVEDEKGKWKSEHHREKRQIDQYEYTPTKTRCPLLLVADYRFFQEMGGSNTKTTINYLVSYISYLCNEILNCPNDKTVKQYFPQVHDTCPSSVYSGYDSVMHLGHG